MSASLARAVLLLGPLLLVACAKSVTPRTQVIVEIDADPQVRAAIRSLRIRVDGSTGRAAGEYVRRFEETRVAGSSFHWPTRVALGPLDGDTARLYRLTATALGSANELVAEVKVLSGYVSGQTLLLRLRFEDGCIGRTCGEDLTCRSAVCADARIDVGTLPAFGADANGVPVTDASVPEASLDTAVPSTDVSRVDAAPDVVPVTDTAPPSDVLSLDASTFVDAPAALDGATDVNLLPTDVAITPDLRVAEASVDASVDSARDAGPSCSILLNGSVSQMVSTTYLPSQATGTIMTYEMWIRPTFLPVSGSAYIMRIGQEYMNPPPGPAQGFVGIVYANGGVSCRAGTTTGSSGVSTGSLAIGEWSHIACEIETAGPDVVNVHQWVNGAYAAGPSNVATSMLMTPLRFGGGLSMPSTESLAGSIDEIRVSSRSVYPRTDVVPSRRFSSVPSVTIALWHFDDCTDSSPSSVGSLIATLEGGATADSTLNP